MYWIRGINLIDTARAYNGENGQGQMVESEILVGNAIRNRTNRNSGVLDKAQKLKDEGVINYIGFSSHYYDTREIKDALDTGIFDVVELPYNIFNRSLGEVQ